MDNMKKKSPRCFQEAWLSNINFKIWIQAVPSNNSIYHCIYCEKDFSCNIYPSKHANSASHKKKINAIEVSPTVNDDSALNNNDNNNNNGTKTGKKIKKYKFQQKWLERKEFKPWLREVVNDENSFSCLFCNKKMIGGLSRIQDHARSQKHIENCKNNKEIIIEDNNSIEKPVLSFETRKKMAEIRYALFITEKNFAYSVAGDTLKFFQQEGHDSKILKNMTLSATKCKNIITNVLAPVATDRLVKKIQKTKFSISIDETTDISKQKWMTFIVRYVDPQTSEVCTQLVKLINIDASVSGAAQLFSAFKCEMVKLDIPFSNIIALSCDNAFVMVGNRESFQKKLENECENLLTINCPCHCSELIAQAACSKIPEEYVVFVKNIANFIHSSPKNTKLYKESFDKTKKSSHRILKLSNTRWLSCYKSIENIIESWKAIIVFLNNITKNNKSEIGKKLLALVNGNYLKAYLLFLKYNLKFFYSFNMSFQSTETRIHLLQSKSLKLLKTICKNFLKRKFIKKVNCNFKFSSTKYHKPLSEVNLGPECEKYLDEVMSEEHDVVADIRKHCLQFYICAAEKICSRLPINNQFLAKLRIFKPEKALCEVEREESCNDLIFIAETLTGFDKIILKNEWLALPQEFGLIEKNQLRCLNFDKMWTKIFQRSNAFPNLKLILNSIRSIFHSNADSERIVSLLLDVKRKKRNKLSNKKVNAACVIKSALKADKKTALNMPITEAHWSRMSSDKLYSYQKKQ